MSPIPVYSRLCVEDSRTTFIPRRFKGENVYIDPDIMIYQNNWIKHLAGIVRQFYELDDLWNLNGGRFNFSHNEWTSLLSYEREAYKMTASHHIEEANKKSRQYETDRKKEIEDAKLNNQQSAFNGITMPRFQN